MTTDLHRAKRGTAMLAACLVQTIRELDPTFQERFLKRLEALYIHVRDDMEGNVTEEMELLSWVREYLTGFDFVIGQGEALLSDYQPR